MAAKPEKTPGNIAQARVALETASAETVEGFLESLREFAWTKEEGAELKTMAEAARARKGSK